VYSTITTYSNGNTAVITSTYTTDAACATPPLYTTETTTSLLKLIYNGTGFIADIKDTSITLTPHNAQMLAIMKQQFPTATFQLNGTTDIKPILPLPNANDIIYTNVKLEDKLKPQQLTWASDNGGKTGNSPELRMTDFSGNVPSFKQ
jgi:hypothetical protein